MNYRIVRLVQNAEDEVLAEFKEFEDAENYLEEKRERESNRLIEKEIANYKALHGEGWIPNDKLETIFKNCKDEAFQAFELKCNELIKTN